MINYWGGRKNSLCMPITLRVFSENQYSCGFLRIVQLWWWKHFEFEVWSHQNPVKLTRKIYLRKNCEPQEKKDEESWKSSADPNNPRDPTVFLRTSRLLLFFVNIVSLLFISFLFKIRQRDIRFYGHNDDDKAVKWSWGGNAISRRWWNPIAAVFSDQTLGQEESGGREGGETGYQVKKGEVEVQKKRKKGSPQKLGLKRSSHFWREELTSFSKNKFLPRKSVFYREISSSLIIFWCQQTLQNQYFAIQEYNRKYHFVINKST